MEGGLSPISGKRKDAEESLLDDGAGSMKKLKRTLTQEQDLKVMLWLAAKEQWLF